MIDQRNSDHFSRLLQTLGHADVLITRRRIAAGVIVNGDDAVRRITDRGAKDFSRVDQAGSQCTDGDLMTLDGNILRIQRDDPELFLLTFTSQSLTSTTFGTDSAGSVATVEIECLCAPGAAATIGPLRFTTFVQ